MNDFGEGLLILDAKAEQILFRNRMIDLIAQNQFQNMEDINEIQHALITKNIFAACPRDLFKKRVADSEKTI